MIKKKIFIVCIVILILVLGILGRNFIFNKIKELFSENINKAEYEVYCGNGKMGDKDSELLDSEFLFNYGIALNKELDLVIVDSYNNKIKTISNDKIATLAGYSDKKDRFQFHLGEYIDGDIKNSKFNKPRDLILDNEGSIYISDSGNNVIRKIKGEEVYTFAGTGEKGYKNGKPRESRFNLPTGIVIDNEKNIYVSDTLNHVIRKISQEGQVSDFAGIKSNDGGFKDGNLNEAMFNEPSDIVIDKNGIMYIADSGNQKIRKIENGKVTTIAGSENEYMNGTSYIKGGFLDGQALKSKFNFPKGLCLDDEGNLYIADTFNHSIRVLKKDGQIYTLIGDGKAGNHNENKLNQPVGLVYKEGYIYISDNKNNIISRLKIN